MPVDYSSVDAIAAAVTDIYGEAEQALIAILTRRLSSGGFDDDTGVWAARKLSEVRALQRTAQLVVDELQRDGNIAIRQAVADGWRSGNTTALTDLAAAHVGDIGPAARVADQSGGAAIQVLADATVAELRPVYAAVLRSTDDVYRRAIAGATARRLTGARDTRRAAQDAYAALVRQGITGFTDSGGRRWRLSTYVEMSTRTAVARAAIAGEVDTWTAGGDRFAYVVDNVRECPLCVVPGTLVEGPVPEWACRLEYSGDLISIRTASGNDLTGTPDHTVLTSRGWRRLKHLKPGDEVISQRRQHGVAGVMPDGVKVPTRIEQFAQTGTPFLATGPTRRDLDSDVAYREIHDIRTDRDLLPELHATLGQPLGDDRLVLRISAASSLLAGSDPLTDFTGSFDATSGVVGGFGPSVALLGGGIVPAGAQAFAGCCRSLFGVETGDPDVTRPGLFVGAAQPVGDRPAGNAVGRAELGGCLAGTITADQLGGLLRSKFGAERPGLAQRHASVRENLLSPRIADTDGGARLMQRFAGEVFADKVVSVGVRQFSGHVWDLQTVPRWFLTNGIVTHNCAPFENKILDLVGPAAEAPAVATLLQAQADGLHHPNCRHLLRLWRPGTRIVAARNAEGPAGYEAEQKQREIERKVRGWRERYAASFDDTGRQYAAKRIAGWSQALADHLDAHPKLPRKSYREHPGAGFAAPKRARTRRDAAHLRPR